MDAIKNGMLATAKAAEAAARIGERLFCQNTPNVMNFNSQICTTKEQSERLLELGLKKETADMALIENWDYDLKDGKFFTGEYFERPIDYVEGMTAHYIPAWSLCRLLSLLPQSVKIGKNYYDLAIIQNEFVRLIDDIGDIYIYFDRDGIYESLLLCIEWLIKEGYFNKEYLL